jgi:hypothetical protein
MWSWLCTRKAGGATAKQCQSNYTLDSGRHLDVMDPAFSSSLGRGSLWIDVIDTYRKRSVTSRLHVWIPPFDGNMDTTSRCAGWKGWRSLQGLYYISQYSLSGLTRVNSTNVLDEGLRIGGIGRRINSKVKSVKQGVYRK